MRILEIREIQNGKYLDIGNEVNLSIDRVSVDNKTYFFRFPKNRLPQLNIFIKMLINRGFELGLHGDIQRNETFDIITIKSEFIEYEKKTKELILLDITDFGLMVHQQLTDNLESLREAYEIFKNRVAMISDENDKRLYIMGIVNTITHQTDSITELLNRESDGLSNI